MGITWRDRHIAAVRGLIKKHRFLTLPLTIWIVLVTIFYNIGRYFARNVKRYASIVAVSAFFFASSSFSFLSPQAQALALMKEDWAAIQENYEYVPTTFNLSQNEVIDDDDVIMGYDNDELDVSADQIDRYSLDDILAANEAGAEVDDTDKQTSSSSSSTISKDDWKLVLVNKQHPIPDDYSVTLGTIKGTMKCDVRIIDDLTDMMQAARRDGINLVVCSPYRDYNRQTVLFNRKIDYYMEKGYSYLEAYRIASITVTVPGASEHQLGLSLDIVSSTYSQLEIEFGETKAGQWLKEHCDEYGFILRYPKGKEYITGIQYEPWHFRYVGKEAAHEIMERDITLEEFVEELD